VAVSWGPNRLDSFIRGNDNGLWHKALNGNVWSNWESLGGVLTSPPTAVSSGPNRIDIFVRGADYGLYHKAWNGNAWSNWHASGGILTSAPMAVSSVAGRADVFAAGQDRELLHQCWNGNTSTWCGWESLGGVLSSSLAAVSWGPNQIDVFAQGRLFAQGQQNMLLHRQYLNGSTWSGWDPMGTCSGYTSVLAANTAMPAGACIWADNGSTALSMQRDGNLCVYNAKSNWCANTVNPSGKHWAAMQGDGNFCIYPNWPAGGNARWCSGTQGHPGAWLVVQDDGNVVIYTQGRHALWATGTNH
jgi:hypothetical protein